MHWVSLSLGFLVLILSTIFTLSKQTNISNFNFNFTTTNNTNLEMTSNAARTVKQIVNAVQRPEGVGATVRRSIGIMGCRNFNPFLMFDHFSSSGTNGFPEHPHKGQETITLVLRGAMAHEDFTGSKGILYGGDLQFMTAGKGVVHSEMPVPSEDGSPTVGLQLWVDLPENLKDAKPRYRDLRSWEIPEVVEQDGKLTVKVISGKSYGVESVKDLAYTPVHYYYYKMKAGATFKQELPSDFNYFLYVLNGNGLVLNGDTKVAQYHNAFLNDDGEYITGEYTPAAGKEDEELEFVLIGGKQLDQKVVQYGPFVATTKEGIEQAFIDYNYARNGFENVKTWRTLISNGVTKEMIEGPLNGNLEKREQARQAYLAAHK
ncbi:RNA pol II transcription cofactor [Scheffersomyces xylosifermentans]|uniref:RNA pol II transcription cofactor n=1 Tax=Scheffersomyces xylosifermentans TaxID=1304137 RepID=UPI00315C7415